MAEPPSGSGRWRTSAWQTLLRSAVRLLETLPARPKVIFGGGTALAVHYQHRVSYDIDLFVANAEVVRDLTPARNPATKALLDGRKYEYPGHYLKLNLDQGEIDFIVATSRTDDPTQPWSFEGTELLIETPWETATKKIFYRSSTFKLRDIFDLAAVIDHHPGELLACLALVDERLDKLADRIQRMAPTYAELAANDLNPTPKGAGYATTEAVLTVLDFVQAFQRGQKAASGTEPR